MQLIRLRSQGDRSASVEDEPLLLTHTDHKPCCPVMHPAQQLVEISLRIHDMNRFEQALSPMFDGFD
jgi:hypothetical protein